MKLLKRTFSSALQYQQSIRLATANKSYEIAFKQITRAYLHGHVLDVFIFRDVALLCKDIDKSWAHMLHKMYVRDFKYCRAIQPLYEIIGQKTEQKSIKELKQITVQAKQKEDQQSHYSINDVIKVISQGKIYKIILHDVSITGLGDLHAECLQKKQQLEEDQQLQQQQQQKQNAEQQQQNQIYSILESLGIKQIKIGRIEVFNKQDKR